MKLKYLDQNFNKLAAYLYMAIAHLENTEEIKAFFEDLCTPIELQAMVDRWLVTKS